MIKINDITLPTAKLYDPTGFCLGELNEYQFINVRIQIKNENVQGYYCIFNGIVINIDEDGGVDHWPDGFFDYAYKNLKILLDF